MNTSSYPMASAPPSEPANGAAAWAPRIVPQQRSVLVREFILSSVATVFNVEPALLLQSSRGPAHIAEARQVAMYLAHVACGLSQTAVGRVFGRDRSTVAHACRQIEDRREDPSFDAAVGVMERSVRAIVGTSSALRRDLELAEQGEV